MSNSPIAFAILYAVFAEYYTGTWSPRRVLRFFREGRADARKAA